jgi:outer membrane protein OmpA-like peptidoglycan-associated protein
MRPIWLLCLALMVSPAWAQSVPSSNTSVQDFVNALKPPSNTRGLARNLTVEAARIEPPPRIDITVGFDFDSSRIQSDSKPVLQNLATAMKSDDLSKLRFRIEGHTDAKGSARYNDALSARRARSVLEFLTDQGVAGDRLSSIGKGASDPLIADDVYSAKNRRVRVSVVD